MLWDVDGTLADSEPLHEQVILDTLREQGLAPPPGLHAELLGLDARAIHALLARRCGLRDDFDAWSARRWRLYRAQAGRLQPRPGALEAFDAAHRRGWVQAAVSNSPREIVELNLRAIGLDGRLQAIVAADDVHRPKPDPEPYLAAQRRLQLPAEACIAVEDSAAGARAAHAAGCTTLYWPHAAPAAGAVPAGCRVVGATPQALWAALHELQGS